MPDIGENEVMAFWRDQMSNKEIHQKLKNLFKRSTTAGITWSRSKVPNQLEGKDSLAECLKYQFGNEDFVILKYGSWIIGSLEDPENQDLEAGFLDFWLQNTRTNKVRLENGKHVFNYANSKQIKNNRAKKFAEAYPWGGGQGREIIAAFSESKILIGERGDGDPPFLAGIVYTVNRRTVPCFSWCSNYPDNPPSSNCLAPWQKSQYWGNLVFPSNSITLFRELIVRCKGDFKFLEESSWVPGVRL